MSTRPTRKTAEPIETCDPTPAPNAAMSFESSQTPPGGQAVDRHAPAERRIRDGHFAPQRVARRSGREPGELRGLAVKDDAQELTGSRRGDAAPDRLPEVALRQRLRSLDTQIRREHLARLPLHNDADAVHEKAHARESCDRDSQREQQHAQLAGFPLPGERTQREQ